MNIISCTLSKLGHLYVIDLLPIHVYTDISITNMCLYINICDDHDLQMKDSCTKDSCMKGSAFKELYRPFE